MKPRFDLTAGSSAQHPALDKAMAALPEADRQWLEAVRADQLHHQAATTNRRDAIARVNAARDAGKHAAVDAALDSDTIALCDQPLTVLVRAVLRYVQVNKLHQKYRLAKPLDPRFVAKKIKARQEKYSTHYCK